MGECLTTMLQNFHVFNLVRKPVILSWWWSMFPSEGVNWFLWSWVAVCVRSRPRGGQTPLKDVHFSYRTRLMAADPFLFPMYYLLFKTVSDKWGRWRPMRTEIAVSFFLLFPFFFPPQISIDGHRGFFTGRYFYTMLSLLPNHTSRSRPQSLHHQRLPRFPVRSTTWPCSSGPLHCCAALWVTQFSSGSTSEAFLSPNDRILLVVVGKLLPICF